MRGAQQKHFPAKHARYTFEFGVAKAALDLDPVGLRQRSSRLQYLIRKFAIVGQKNGATRGVVEAAHGKYTFRNADEEISQRAAALRIGERGNHFRWFVEEQINVSFSSPREMARGFDPVMLWVGFCA
jgi:hypothetical protein